MIHPKAFRISELTASPRPRVVEELFTRHFAVLAMESTRRKSPPILAIGNLTGATLPGASVTDGAVLPILHLNGYKISNPTVLARITHEELEQLLRGYGWDPHFVECHEPDLMHEAMAATLDTAVQQIKKIQEDARVHGNLTRPRWPMIVLKSPKGWTGPKMIDGLQVEGTFRAHQVPLSDPATHPKHLKLLEDWRKSYRPEELFDEQGRLMPELAELAPKGDRRMGSNPHANGGILLRDLKMPDFRNYMTLTIFTKPTVFVLGSGVSVPFGFPSGEKILQIIAGNIDNEDPNFLALRTQHQIAVSLLKALLARPGEADVFVSTLPTGSFRAG